MILVGHDHGDAQLPSSLETFCGRDDHMPESHAATDDHTTYTTLLVLYIYNYIYIYIIYIYTYYIYTYI